MGCEAICDIIDNMVESKQLLEMLTANNIGDEGALMISELLTNNTNLRELGLRGSDK